MSSTALAFLQTGIPGQHWALHSEGMYQLSGYLRLPEKTELIWGILVNLEHAASGVSRQ